MLFRQVVSRSKIRLYCYPVMAMERATIAPEQTTGSGAPLTPPSEGHSGSAKSPRVVHSQIVEEEQTPLQAISHGILMDGEI